MPRKAKPEELVISAHVETIGHAVLRDGQPCKLVNVSGSRKGGVLMPGAPVVSFLKVRDAERAIERTERVRRTLRGSLVADWLRELVPSFLAGEQFTVVSIAKQTEKPSLQEIGRPR